jgi:cell division protein FtsN
MEVINQEATVVDPWHGKSGTLSVITLSLLSMFLILAVYDGAIFYARIQQKCLQHPNSAECKNFNKPVNVPVKPKLDLILDYTSGKYAIQVGAYKNEETAKNTAAQLQSYGVQPRIIKVKRAKRNISYQVQLGRFADQKLASQMAQQLKLKGFIQDFTIANYAGK